MFAMISFTDDIPIQKDDGTGAANPPIQQTPAIQLGSINEELESEVQAANKVQSGKVKDGTSKVHKAPFQGLKKLIDREKDKDKDSVTTKQTTSSIIKNGLNDTKENVKKFITKDKQNKPPLMSGVTFDDVTSDKLSASTINSSNVGNSPLSLIKRKSSSIDVTTTSQFNGPITSSHSNDILLHLMSSNETNESSNVDKLPDIVNMSLKDNNATSIVVSPFEKDGKITDFDNELQNQQSLSSSSSTNILMDNNAKMAGANVQVSQV